MEYKESLKMLLSVQMDDLKDAEMLVDYAEKARDCGDDTLANRYTSRAKTRLQWFEENQNSIDSMLARMRVEEEGSESQAMAAAEKMVVKEWSAKIKSKMEV